MLPYLLILALSGCVDDDCWGCEEILIVENHFEPLARTVAIDICDGDYCANAVVGRGRCLEPNWPDEGGFYICYGDEPPAGVWAHRRFLVTSGGTHFMPNEDVSLRIVADGVTLVDAVGLPSVERYEACGQRCSTRRLTF